MSNNTKIAWCDVTWNPLRVGNGWHCTKVSSGCERCYAEAFNKRFGNGQPYDNSSVAFRLDEKVLNQPLHWRKPRHVFVQSMGDLFHEKIPLEFVHKILDIVQMCPQHTFQILTKRPERMTEIHRLVFGVLQNVWLGVSVETEKYLHRVNALNEIPATIRFVSLEPLLEEMHIEDYLKRLQWVICGPETGSRRRPCKREWIESIIKQCDAAGVPVFIKTFPLNGKILHDVNQFPKKFQRREFPK